MTESAVQVNRGGRRNLIDFDKVLSMRGEVYGLLAIWIVFFHISGRVAVPLQPGLITPLIKMGNIGVDLFLLISGYCLSISWQKNHNLKTFYVKRVKRLLIPYFVFSIPFYIWKVFSRYSNKSLMMKIVYFFYDLSFASFWRNGNQDCWFVAAILLFYMLFPLVYKIINHSFSSFIIFFGSVLLFNLVGYFFISVYAYSSIAWVRFLPFLLGIGFYVYGNDYSVPTIIKTIFVLLAIIFTFVFPIRDLYINYLNENLGGRNELLWFLYIFLLPGILFLIHRGISFVFPSLRKLLSIIGNLSLENYMVHLYLLKINDFYFKKQEVGAWLYLIIPVMTLALCLLYNFVFNIFTRK